MTNATQDFNWKGIRAALSSRLSHLGATLDGDEMRVQALLRERTLRLAAKPKLSGANVRPDHMMVLVAAGERYGLALGVAQEVVMPMRTALLPGSAPSIVGIINWRGEFVTVFDLARLLGLTPAEDGRRRRIVVLRNEDPRLALSVDGVEHIADVDRARLQPPEELRAQRSELFRGATADGLVVFDENKLLGTLREDLVAA